MPRRGGCEGAGSDIVKVWTIFIKHYEHSHIHN